MFRERSFFFREVRGVLPLSAREIPHYFFTDFRFFAPCLAPAAARLSA